MRYNNIQIVHDVDGVTSRTVSLREVTRAISKLITTCLQENNRALPTIQLLLLPASRHQETLKGGYCWEIRRCAYWILAQYCWIWLLYMIFCRLSCDHTWKIDNVNNLVRYNNNSYIQKNQVVLFRPQKPLYL